MSKNTPTEKETEVYSIWITLCCRLIKYIYQEIEGHKQKFGRAEVIYANSKTESNPDDTKPSHMIGFLGLIGKKIDTIEYCSEHIKELLPKLEAEQKTTQTVVSLDPFAEPCSQGGIRKIFLFHCFQCLPRLYTWKHTVQIFDNHSRSPCWDCGYACQEPA